MSRNIQTHPSCFATPPAKDLRAMLLGGEIDAEVGLADLDAPEVRTVIPDAAAAAADWSRRTGVRPINHVVAIKTELLQAHPWLARELYALFVQARTSARRRPTAWRQIVPRSRCCCASPLSKA